LPIVKCRNIARFQGNLRHNTLTSCLPKVQDLKKASTNKDSQIRLLQIETPYALSYLAFTDIRAKLRVKQLKRALLSQSLEVRDRPASIRATA